MQKNKKKLGDRTICIKVNGKGFAFVIELKVNVLEIKTGKND